MPKAYVKAIIHRECESPYVTLQGSRANFVVDEVLQEIM